MTDREKLIEWLLEVDSVCHVGDCEDCCDDGICFIHRAADNLLANGVTVQKHGRWIEKDMPKLDGTVERKAVCSLCGVPNKQYKPPYCPHCGARMDGEA